MIVLAVSGLAFGATFVTPMPTAERCICNAIHLTQQAKPAYCCMAGAEPISYRPYDAPFRACGDAEFP